MKNTILLWALSLLISGALTAQKSKTNKEIVINGSFLEPDGCGLQTISLWSWNGAMPEELLRSPVGVKDGKSTFSFTLPAGKKGIYYLGNDPQQLSVLVLNGEDKITLGGSCKILNQISPSNSVANTQYNKLLETQQAHFQEFIQYINQYRGAMGNATAMAHVDAFFPYVVLSGAFEPINKPTVKFTVPIFGGFIGLIPRIVPGAVN